MSEKKQTNVKPHERQNPKSDGKHHVRGHTRKVSIGRRQGRKPRKRGGTDHFSHFPEDNPMRVLEEHGFFPYSGSDGDLFRKNGLAGWRVRVDFDSVSIQKKGDCWGGKQRWNTVEEFGDSDNPSSDRLTKEEKREFEEALDYLVEHDDLEGW